MLLICYGTRPEIIKLFPLIHELKNKNIIFKTLFTGQHVDLLHQFVDLIPTPNYTFNVMEKNQSLSILTSKILIQMQSIFDENNDITQVIVQGDTTSSYGIALASFYNMIPVIHVEAGLRTFNSMSPYPEEMNRCLISKIAKIHLAPTQNAVDNLEKENIKDYVYNVGNTIVDSYKFIIDNYSISTEISKIVREYPKYLVVTLHRRENRGEKIKNMWRQLNKVSEIFPDVKIIYIKHHSLPEVRKYVNDSIIVIDPLQYEDMIHLVNNSCGIITDSGGLQEEATCCNKKVLICRNTTERPETVDCGLGLLVDDKIVNNIEFLFNDTHFDTNDNPYGKDACRKIVNILF